MKRYFLTSIQGRVMLILLLFMTLSLATSWFVIRFTSQSIMSSEKEEKLLAMASLLDFSLGDRSYNDILIENNAEDASKEEKIEILNKELSPLGEKMVIEHPDLGIGYYSLELDAIITYAPSKLYSSSVGVPIAEDHPGRLVMKNNEAMVRTGTMVRGDIMNAMHPIERDGIVIGYAWANELASTIEGQYRTATTSIMLILLAIYIFSIVMSIAFAKRSTRDINNIIQGVRTLQSDLTHRIPKASGNLGEVAESINAMAADILKAEEEHKARILAEASNDAQRDFLSRMSHELRTPMNGVLGMTTLAQNAETEEKRVEYLDKIHASASLLLRIINDILDISKIEAGKMDIESHPFLVRNIISNIEDLILPRTQEKGLEFNIILDNSVPEKAVGDELRISQVLLNIVGNAVKFTSTGSITLTLSAKEEDKDGLFLMCSVRDTGVGMNEKQQQAVFNPFTQADGSTARKFGGTGLGLSISKALVDLMGGEISVQSKLGEGSNFIFSVKVKPYDKELTKNVDLSDALLDVRFDNLMLLLVEDNEINQEIAKEVLKNMGFVVDLADNGLLGVEAFKEKAYDLIFMDIRMPIMDGIEATREIRKIENERIGTEQELPRVPIIAMTANVMQEDREATHEAGMDGHISKPIDRKEIITTIIDTLGAKEME